MSLFRNLKQHKGLTCYLLGEPDVNAAELWDYLIKYLAKSNIASSHYTLASGLGRRRPFRDPSKPMNSEEIRKEIELDDSNTFWLMAVTPNGKIHETSNKVEGITYFPTPLDGGLQRFNISWRSDGCNNINLDELVGKLSEMSSLILAYSFNPIYNGWQTCRDPGTYRKRYGPIEGFSLVERGSPPHRREWLDDSKNPGRGTVNGRLPHRAAAEMWLHSHAEAS